MEYEVVSKCIVHSQLCVPSHEAHGLMKVLDARLTHQLQCLTIACSSTEGFMETTKHDVPEYCIFEHTCAYARLAHMHRFLSVCHWTKIQTRK